MHPLGRFSFFNDKKEKKNPKIKWRTNECDKYSFTGVYLTQ